MGSNIFNRKENVVLGVCSYMYSKYNLKPLYLRLFLVLLVFFIKPYALLLYFLLAIIFKTVDKKNIFSIIGFVLGIALILLVFKTNSTNYSDNNLDFLFALTFWGFIILYSTTIALSFGKIRKIYGFSILGAVLGIPLSYLFQGETIIYFSGGGIAGYISNLYTVIQDWNLLSNILLSIIIFLFIGALWGYLIEKNESKKQ
jgi:phage shock protein PspC (stress-responsive transcriptional regulator)